MKLEKATITELDGDPDAPPLPVQFNPTTLKLSLSNQVEGGDSHGKQVRQHVGPSSTTLSLDLVFDSADEGTTEEPSSVREKTKRLERFLFPKGEGKHVPPRIRFTWGDLIVEGVVDSLSIDFDHFAANGVPLRAKVSLSIKGQDRDRELKPKEDDRRGAPAPLGGGLGIGLSASASVGFGASGGVGFGASANVGVALGGESSADFAARVGVDPAAWRGLQIGGESSISLSAGVEVGFDAGLNASAGLGVTTGVEAGASVSLEASFGLEADASLNAVAGIGVGAELASGVALSSAGGVGAALESVQSARNQLAEQQTRAAFQSPAKALPAAGAPTSQATASASNAPRAVGAQPKPPEQSRTPLSSTGLPTPGSRRETPPAPRPPRADARASSFGFGVPLRSTVGEAADLRAESIQGGVALKPRITGGEPPATNDPTTPGWVALPARDRGRKNADKIQGLLRPSRPCGCARRCRH
jgi:hypothetical protein